MDQYHIKILAAFFDYSALLLNQKNIELHKGIIFEHCLSENDSKLKNGNDGPSYVSDIYQLKYKQIYRTETVYCVPSSSSLTMFML